MEKVILAPSRIFLFSDSDFLEYCAGKVSEAKSVLGGGNILQSAKYGLPWTTDGARQHACQAITSLVIITQQIILCQCKVLLHSCFLVLK